jgi:hypothetical protein
LALSIMKTQRKKIILWTAAGLFLVITAACTGLFFYLPVLVENRWLPQLARKLGLTPEQIQVQRIAFTGTDLGPIRCSVKGRPVLFADTIRLRYSPMSLLHGRIDRLTIIDLSIEISHSDKDGRVAGIQQPTGPEQPDAWRRRLESMLPLSLQSITLENAQVIWVRHDQMLTIPLSAEIDASQLRQGRLAGRFRMWPMESRIEFKAQMDMRQNLARLDVTHLQAAFEEFAPYLTVPPDLRLVTRIDAQGWAQCRLTPFMLQDMKASAFFYNPVISRPGSQKIEPVEITASLPVQLEFAARRDSANPLEFQLSAGLQGQAQSAPLAVKSGRMQMAAHLSRVDLSGTYQGRRAQFEMQLHAPQIHVDEADRRINGQLKATTHAVIDFSGPETHISGSTHAELSGVTIRNDSLEMNIELVSAAARWIQSAGSAMGLSGHLLLSKATVADNRRTWKADGIDARLPVSWPLSKSAPAGKVMISSLQWRRQSLGAIQGTLQQQAGGLSIAAQHTSQLFPGLNVLMKVRLDPNGAVLDFDLPAFRSKAAIDLGRFFQNAAGYQFYGQLKARGRLSFEGSSAKGRVDAQIEDGTLQQAGSGLNLKGIRAGVQFKNVFKLETGSGPYLKIKDLQMGKIQASDLNVAFQIKGPDAIVIEQAGVAWCGGTIHTGGIDLSTSDFKLEVMLIGKDLNPVLLLEQLGVAQGKGCGTVSGRIPFTYHHGWLRFKNARLASPPGQLGTLQLERLGGSEYLYSGLPEGAPQRTQLDIALEALKDYTYEYIELRLKSEREELLLRLRLNGKPNRLLPFEYDSEAGKFSRNTGQGQAEFKGIDIDLNFRSPLDEILRYSKLLKEAGKK